jgi:gamma-glutamyltranspeptidase/glutathione hydrolase
VGKVADVPVFSQKLCASSRTVAGREGSQAAIHQPRVDASEGAVVIGDVRLPMQVREALQARFDYEEARVQTLPMKFACPSVVLREGGTNSGASEIFQPWGDAVAEG